jgi:pilus assembly protein CpaE
MSSITLLVASTDENFRELVRESLLNFPNAKVVSEYPEVATNLYIRVLQDVERHPEAALVLDLAGDPETGLKALDRVKQAAPDLYVIAANYAGDADAVIAAVRSGANDFLQLPLRRTDFREAMSRLERAPRRAVTGGSQLGRVYAFLGAKGGVGTTSLAVNFAAVLAQRKQSAVLLDVDWSNNDVAMHLGAGAQTHSLFDLVDSMGRLDQTLFEGLAGRDPLGLLYLGPPDALMPQGYYMGPLLQELTTFLVEKYNSIILDVGSDLNSELVQAALQSSSVIFLVMTQDFPAIRNAQRTLSFLVQLGYTVDQIKVVVNQYNRKPGPHHATLDQIQQTLNQQVFYGIPASPAVLASINRGRPFVADREAAGELDKVFRAFVDKATGRKKKEQELAITA